MLQYLCSLLSRKPLLICAQSELTLDNLHLNIAFRAKKRYFRMFSMLSFLITFFHCLPI